MSRGRGYNVVTLFIGRVPKLISLPSDHPDAGSGWQDATLYGRQGCLPPRSHFPVTPISATVTPFPEASKAVNRK